MQAREGDKHTIYIGRSCWMRTLLLQTGVAYIARSNLTEMGLCFPVATVHVNQYGRAELLKVTLGSQYEEHFD